MIKKMCLKVCRVWC